MPRTKQGAEARRAAHAQAKAKWRQRVAAGPSQSRGRSRSQSESSRALVQGAFGREPAAAWGAAAAAPATAATTAAAAAATAAATAAAAVPATAATAAATAAAAAAATATIIEEEDDMPFQFGDDDADFGNSYEADSSSSDSGSKLDELQQRDSSTYDSSDEEDIRYPIASLDTAASSSGSSSYESEGEVADLYDTALYDGEEAVEEAAEAEAASLYEAGMTDESARSDEEIEEAGEAEEGVDSHEAGPPILAEEQLQQELRESEDRGELNLPLQLGLHLLDSFSCDGHADSYERHRQRQEEEENHWSLDDLNRSTQRLPDVLSSPNILPYNSAHRQASYDWPRLFEGCSDELGLSESEESSLAGPSLVEDGAESRPATVCLACSEQPARTNAIQYDIDSMLGFAESLAFAKQGLYLNFAPQFHQNLQANVHLSLPVIDHSSGRARTKHVPLFKVPHIRLGRVVGAEGISVYIFFPKQWSAEKPTNFPGKLGGRPYGVLERWTDSILLPSLANCLSSDVAQHLPPSLLLAQLRASARHFEQQARTSRQDFLHQSLHYFVQGHLLGALWEEVVRRCQLLENILFATPRLVFSSKGQKLLYKGRTIAGTWNLFRQSAQHYFDYSHLNTQQVWVDLGKEVACADWAFSTTDAMPNRTREPQVYLWRRCCIEHLASWIQFAQPTARTKAARYIRAMLGDSLEATFEFSRASKQYLAGWIYSQAYDSVKELYDAAKVIPFKAGFLDKLT